METRLDNVVSRVNNLAEQTSQLKKDVREVRTLVMERLDNQPDEQRERQAGNAQARGTQQIGVSTRNDEREWRIPKAHEPSRFGDNHARRISLDHRP